MKLIRILLQEAVERDLRKVLQEPEFDSYKVQYSGKIKYKNIPFGLFVKRGLDRNDLVFSPFFYSYKDSDKETAYFWTFVLDPEDMGKHNTSKELRKQALNVNLK